MTNERNPGMELHRETAGNSLDDGVLPENSPVVHGQSFPGYESFCLMLEYLDEGISR